MLTPWITPSIPRDGSAPTDIIVIKTAVPIAPAICLKVLFIAVPCGMSSFGNWLIDSVVIGIITIAIETIRTAFIVAR